MPLRKSATFGRLPPARTRPPSELPPRLADIAGRVAGNGTRVAKAIAALALPQPLRASSELCPADAARLDQINKHLAEIAKALRGRVPGKPPAARRARRGASSP